MAQLDVSELMVDPDFVDDIRVVSRTPQVNSLGENVLTECSVATIGSVQPADYKTVKRLPEALQNEDVSSFWVKGPSIVASAPGKYTTILVFRGRRFQVQTVADWSNFGEGYCEGTCVAEKPS